MIGIPETGTPEALAFWTAFWPALWSGAIYSVICGIVVGVIVGIVLILFQKGSEKRAIAQNHARDLSLKMDQLRNAISLEDVVTITHAKDTMPAPATAVLQALSDSPLTLWRETLPKKAIILDAAINLQKCCANYNGIASAVDHELRQQVRAYNHAKTLQSINDKPYHMYAVGKMLDFSGESLLQWVSSTSRTVEPYEKVWETIRQTGRVVQLMPQLQQARGAVLDAVETIRRTINA
ncbi:MAG: hypothetical protein KJ550_06530 [Proteobacteria bacterium]|nr:hypothetical protein [Pseudomonadota bacterium]